MRNSILLLLIFLLTSCGQPSKPYKHQSHEIDSTIDSYELQDSLDYDDIATIPYANPDSLKVGQVWLYITNRENPFENKINHYQKIIAIKNGYVQYIDNDEDTISSRIGLFIVNITKVE